jgi:hypothetical protein
MEVTVINNRKGVCDMGGQHTLLAHRHSKFIHRYTLMVCSHRDKIIGSAGGFLRRVPTAI